MLSIGAEGPHACSTNFQVKGCFQDKGPESCLTNSAQDTIIDLEDQIKDLEDVVRQTMGRDGEIKTRLLPNEAKRK
jgi:hypothetical protein